MANVFCSQPVDWDPLGGWGVTGVSVQQRAEAAEQTQASSAPGGCPAMDKDRPPRQKVEPEKQREQRTETRQVETHKRRQRMGQQGAGGSRLRAEAGGGIEGMGLSEDAPSRTSCCCGVFGLKTGKEALRLEANPWNAGVGHPHVVGNWRQAASTYVCP